MKTKYLIGAVLLTLVIITGVIVLVSNRGFYTVPYHGDIIVESILKTEPINLSNISAEKLAFAKYYSLDPLDIELQTAQYSLPLKTPQISNYKDFSEKISLDDKALGALNKNGFTVIDNPFNSNEEDITNPYKTLKDKEIPIFITSDSLLHLYHIQFDETLRQIEEREFYDSIWEINRELLERLVESFGALDKIYVMPEGVPKEKRKQGIELLEAYRRNIIYLSVGLELLKPKDDQAKEECAKGDWECHAQDATAYFTKEELDKYNFEIPF